MSENFNTVQIHTHHKKGDCAPQFPQPAEPVSPRLGDIKQGDSCHLAFLETAAIVSSPKGEHSSVL